MSESDALTCGRGLAAHSVVPAKLAELTNALAETLELHVGALDDNDEDTKRERDIYARLAQEYRDIATRLGAAGQAMAEQADLPMGKHDEEALTSTDALEAFERFVRYESELYDLLDVQVEQDQRMLVSMSRAQHPHH